MVISFSRLLLLFLPIIALTALGIWQLQRAKEKADLIARQQQAAASSASVLTGLDAIELENDRYRPVQLTGHYQADQQFLLDNQIHQGRPGFYVFTPFVIEASAEVVLVNRGWIQWPENRSQQPDLTVSQNLRTLTGRINRFPGVGLILEGATEPGPGWPSRVGVIDSQRLARHLGYPLADFQIELSPEAPDGYLRDWRQAFPMPPEKHRAYAVQWFGLALTWPALLIYYFRRKSS